MVVINSVNQRFAVAFWVDVPRNFFQHRAIEIFSNHTAVKALNIKLELIFQLVTVGDFSGDGVIYRNRFTRLISDTLITQLSVNIMGRVVVNKKTLNHCAAIGVFKHRLTENLGGM